MNLRRNLLRTVTLFVMVLYQCCCEDEYKGSGDSGYERYSYSSDESGEGNDDDDDNNEDYFEGSGFGDDNDENGKDGEDNVITSSSDDQDSKDGNEADGMDGREKGISPTSWIALCTSVLGAFIILFVSARLILLLRNKRCRDTNNMQNIGQRVQGNNVYVHGKEVSPNLDYEIIGNNGNIPKPNSATQPPLYESSMDVTSHSYEYDSAVEINFVSWKETQATYCNIKQPTFKSP